MHKAIEVLMNEHRLIERVLVGDGTGPLTAMETGIVLENASAFIPLLRAHIQKEDRKRSRGAPREG